MSSVAKRLRAARERKNLKQIQVMKMTGINNKTLSGYENGVSEPDLDTLKLLADLYEVRVDWLLGKEIVSPGELDMTEKKLFAEFQKLSEEDKDYVLGLIRRINKK